MLMLSRFLIRADSFSVRAHEIPHGGDGTGKTPAKGMICGSLHYISGRRMGV
jgi:hypothetical protein